ncbi:MAG TPA: PIN domain-containing protein [Candidatus Acidoferrum sp.]|nr:PIN domain-containing protein [Candidatus Acidoferrum sp.]
MSGRAFFDTNILIYSLGAKDPRGRRAEQLLLEGGVVSVQVLNEFSDVARRKIRMSWNDVRQALREIQFLCPDPAPITTDTHEHALMIAESHGIRIYDALILASALGANCTTLYSEDLQDGQVIEKRLTIRNPFSS